MAGSGVSDLIVYPQMKRETGELGGRAPAGFEPRPRRDRPAGLGGLDPIVSRRGNDALCGQASFHSSSTDPTQAAQSVGRRQGVSSACSREVRSCTLWRKRD